MLFACLVIFCCMLAILFRLAKTEVGSIVPTHRPILIFARLFNGARELAWPGVDLTLAFVVAIIFFSAPQASHSFRANLC